MRIRLRLANTGRSILTLLVLALLSCATTGSGKQKQLVGTWRNTTDARTAEYVFAADGTFAGSVTAGGALLADFTGRWSLQGNELLYEYLTDKTGNIAPGTRDHDRLLTVTSDQYVIEAADGSKRTYARVRQ